jgi:hypothetical protein
MQSKYTVTTELKTSVITKILRFFRVKPKLNTFTIILNDSSFRKGDVFIGYEGEKMLVVKKEQQHFINYKF